MSIMKKLNTNVCYSFDVIELGEIKADLIKAVLYNEVQVYIRLEGKSSPVPSKADPSSQNESDKSVSMDAVLELIDIDGVQVYINPLMDINDSVQILEKMVAELKDSPPYKVWEEAYHYIG